MAIYNLRQMRFHAISHSLFRPTTLKEAINCLKFVQADPIRSPAKAQDLILRHRVKGYQVGDLELNYPSLDIEEDVLYAYGFLPRQIYCLLYPRSVTSLSNMEREVLAAVSNYGPMHPKELEAQFGSKRVINDWGGYSKATKRALEHLHYYGLLRVARREKGIRIYETATSYNNEMSPNERFRELLLVIAYILAPVSKKTLQALAARLRRSISGVSDHRSMIRDLLQTGELDQGTIDDIIYVWPAFNVLYEEVPRHVRFLAPFDPLVWDRRRFEHFWQWPYRFEAYTPPSKRIRGYYAMPLLWGDQIIGWANTIVTKQKLRVELGFVERCPTDHNFHTEIEAEIARLKTFLNLESANWEVTT